MKRYWAALVLALCGVSMNAMAFTWVGPVTILGYYSFDSDNAVRIRTSGTHINPDNCADNRYLVLDANSARFKELYTALVAAQASGSTVSVIYAGCLGQHPKIISIAVPVVW